MEAATRPAIHFPGSPVTGRHAPVTYPQVTGPERASRFPPPPSIRSAPHTPVSPSRLRIQALHRFHGLHPISKGPALPAHARGRMSNDAAGFASCYGPNRRSPAGAFDAGLRPRPFPGETASLLPGLLAATRTGLSPAGDDELTNTWKHHGTTPRCHLPLCWAHEKTSLNPATSGPPPRRDGRRDGMACWETSVGELAERTGGLAHRGVKQLLRLGLLARSGEMSHPSEPRTQRLAG